MFEGHHYQNAYICDDIEVAIAEFRKRADVGGVRIHDIANVLQFDDGPKALSVRLAFIWIGDLQYELIQVVHDETGVYSQCTSNGGILNFHHICMRVDGDWESFRERVAAQDLPVVLERANPGDPLKYLYLDARATCGHFLEYTWMTDERWTQVQAM